MMQPAAAAILHAAHATLATCVRSTDGGTVCSSSLGVGLGIALFLYVPILVLSIIAAVKVVTKAGYSGWWVLVMILPLVNFVMLLVFAFSKWPVLAEVEALRGQGGGRQGYGPPPGWGAGLGAGGIGGTPYGPGPPSGGPRAAGPEQSFGSAPPFVSAPVPGPGPANAAAAAPAAPAGAMGHAPAEAEPLPSFWQFRPDEAQLGPTGPQGTGEPGPSGAGAVATRPSDATPAPPTARAPAGWYPTPEGRQRYWDGTAWTDHFA